MVEPEPLVLTNRPARGTRPRNRRQLIVDAAGDLFYRHGYAAVSMSDIAEAVAIGPSALYRHFSGKNDLLATVIEGALGQLDRTLQDAGAEDDLAAVLTNVALNDRSIGVLWNREIRQLSSARRQETRALILRIHERIADLLQSRRPGLTRIEAVLLAWCATGVANSVSFHDVTLPEYKFSALIRLLVGIALSSPAQSLSVQPMVPEQRTTAPTRREAILIAATTLFAHRGFAAVSIDDIVAAAGIPEPSIYSHFPSKSDIFTALTSRGNGWLAIEFSRAVADAAVPGQALARVIRSYQRFALSNPNLLAILVSESQHLPQPEKRRVQGAHRGYVDEWVHLARTEHPQWSLAEARIRVLACQIMMSDVAVIERLRNTTGVDRVLVSIGEELLQIKSQPVSG